MQRACRRFVDAASQVRYSALLLEQQPNIDKIAQEASSQATIKNLQAGARRFGSDYLGTEWDRVPSVMTAAQDATMDVKSVLAEPSGKSKPAEASESLSQASEVAEESTQELVDFCADHETATQQLLNILDTEIDRVESRGIKDLEKEIENLEEEIRKCIERISDLSVKYGEGIGKILRGIVEKIIAARNARGESGGKEKKEKSKDAGGLAPAEGEEGTGKASKEIAAEVAKIHRNESLLRQKYAELARNSEMLSGAIGVRISLNTHKSLLERAVTEGREVTQAYATAARQFAAADAQEVADADQKFALRQWKDFDDVLTKLTRSLSD
ncbi:hypothetical protein ACH4VM_16800 [Streptomyces sp. NPDC020792]|uniref:hypothetical protein n=1 Tax=Streptomyces sp. NPDC020792 TaxID=3365089 RepID=UPI00379C07B4